MKMTEVIRGELLRDGFEIDTFCISEIDAALDTGVQEDAVEIGVVGGDSGGEGVVVSMLRYILY